jgi:peptidoglycan/xylan/chitin deacetylase (PgdA/CDA1 family)
MDRTVTRTLLALTAVTALLVAITVALAGPAHPTGVIRSAVVLRGVPLSESLVAITVDDGPTRTYTPEVLAILKRHHAKATFFVIGRSAERAPDLVRDEVAQGCEVGSHTWSHARVDRISDAQIRAEVVRGAEALEAITGRPPLYFRPPRGFISAAIVDAAASEGMRTVLWSLSLDHRADRTPGDAAERVLGRVGPGDVILLHDGGGHRGKSVAALDILLTDLEARGYRFVTLSELYRAGGIRL